MASARYAWGIDVGNRALKAVRLARTGGGVVVDDIDVIEHEHVLSHAGDNKESLIQQALVAFAQRHNLKGSAVGVGVSGQSSFARFIPLPPVEARKIPEIVRFEAIQQIPFPLEEVEWSYQLFREEGSPDVEVGIFAMRRELVNHYIGHFTGAGVSVDAVQMNPLAVYNALYHDGKTAGGTTMVIDLGAEHTDLIIADGEKIWMRPIPIGGNNFTEALTKAFKLRFEKAEELKRNAATSKYGRQILQAMRPVFADLVSEIQRSIGFYTASHRDARISKVIALGGTFRLPGLQKYLQQNLQLEVQRLESLGGGPPADAKVAATLNDNLLSSVGAYGLALQAMGQAKITSSLLPQHIRRERMWRDKTKWFAAAAALFVVGAVGIPLAVYQINEIKLSNAAPKQSDIQSAAAEFQQFDSNWTSQVESAGEADRTQIVTIMDLTKGRGVWAPLTVDIASALPAPSEKLRTRSVEQIKSVPRNERNFVWVDEWTTQYVPNITPMLTMAPSQFKSLAAAKGGGGGAAATPGGPLGGAAAAPAEGEAAAAPQRGFLITLWCTTPSKDYGKIADKIAQDMEQTKKLVDARLKEKIGSVPYKIERVEVVVARKLQPDAPASPFGGGGGGAGGVQQWYQRPGGGPQPGGFQPGGQYAPGGDPAFGAGGGQFTSPNYGAQGQGGPRPATGPGDPNMPRYPMPPLTEIFNPNDPNRGGNPANAQDQFRDPVTGEDTRSDYELQFLIAVVLDPPPPAAPPEDGSTPAADQTASAAGAR